MKGAAAGCAPLIRVHQIALPLDHPPEALPKAVAKRLKLPLEALGELQLFRRSVDARHKGAIELVYSVDVPVADEAAVLGKLRRDSRVMATPFLNRSLLSKAMSVNSDSHELLEGGKHGHRDRRSQ